MFICYCLQVYSLAQFYNMLQTMLAYVYPNAVTCSAECLVSIKRIQKFLLLEEKDPMSWILDSEAKLKAKLFSEKKKDLFIKPGSISVKNSFDEGIINYCELRESNSWHKIFLKNIIILFS